MDTESFKVLEYEKIKTRLASYAATAYGKERCSSIMPSSNYDHVARLHRETEEAVRVAQIQPPPFDGIHHLQEILKQAGRGILLELDELRLVKSTIGGMRDVKYFFRDLSADAELLKDLARRIEILGMLERNLKAAIDEYGNFRDDASSVLHRITNELRTAQSRVKDRLSSILHDAAYQKMFQEAIVTVRDERYVIPVKQEYRSQFPGVIHDQSASGATLFIEPLAIVELNNTVRQMGIAREQEILRIMQRLTGEIARSADILSANCTILSDLDLIFARASLAREMRAYPPILNRDGYVYLRRARHPLLPLDKVVPIDIELGKTFSTLLITGPNTGGKTVSMKTLGILALMSQSGCFLPVESGSEIPVYQNIYADIGDEQSIEQSLSTFSAHTRNIVRIIDRAASGDLVLLDEVGAGTDPDEGAALARSIIEHFLMNRIATVATTHLQISKRMRIHSKALKMPRLNLTSKRSVRPIACSSVYQEQAMPFPSAANSVCQKRSLHGRKNMSAKTMPTLKPLFMIWNVPRRFMRKKISSSIKKKWISAELRNVFEQNVQHLSSRRRNFSIRHAKRQTILYAKQDA